MRITILTDNKDSWFVPYGEKLVNELRRVGNDVKYVFNKRDILSGDICFLLSCTRIVNAEYLKRNRNNIVVHASDLPHGKGFSPMQWQILEGKNRINLTLFEAVEAVDAGPYYLKDEVDYDGTELYNELRDKLSEKVIKLCLYFVTNYKDMVPKTLLGSETFYLRRTHKNDEIDINKSIKEQFNHLRIADNVNYPLWFEYRGVKYNLKIEKRN